ncbi:zf-HC2 domain-containing protein [bacterium]|nr:zf-HC2 domain-containing protein [bacterium]
MRCERVQFLYSEYVAGTLSPETLDRIEEHLGACRACRDFYEESDRLGSLIRSQGEVAHPGSAYFDDLAARVLGELEKSPPPREANYRRLFRVRPLWWSGVATAAALAVMAIAPMFERPEPVQTASLTTDVSITKPEIAGDGAGLTLAPAPSGKVLVKGVSNPAAPITIVDEILPGGAFVASPFVTKPELQVAREAEMRMAALRSDADRRTLPPGKILEQIELIKSQLIVGSNEDLRRGLMELEASVRGQVKDPSQVQKLPMVKQSEYYARGEEELAAGHPDDAYRYFQRVLLVDPTTPLAVRANLQMADLLFSEKANFKQALAFYRKCQGAGRSKALNSAERLRVQRQIGLLEQYRANGWQALARIHSMARDPWPEAIAALRDLASSEHDQPLLPEAARATVERFNNGDKPAPESIMEIYGLLSAKAAGQAGGESRAYLELYLGELSVHLAQPKQAIDHFMAATKAAEGSVAAGMARAKIAELEEKSLKDLVRN